jgi:hypothetical protein
MKREYKLPPLHLLASAPASHSSIHSASEAAPHPSKVTLAQAPCPEMFVLWLPAGELTVTLFQKSVLHVKI